MLYIIQNVILSNYYIAYVYDSVMTNSFTSNFKSHYIKLVRI